MTVLEDLWYGNIDPHEAILTGSKRYKHVLTVQPLHRDCSVSSDEGVQF